MGSDIKIELRKPAVVMYFDNKKALKKTRQAGLVYKLLNQ
jgi:hypothetical protein